MSEHLNAGTVEFYRERHAIETPLTLEVLRALPTDKLADKPHEQSSSAEAIFWTVVRGLITRNEVAAIGETDLTAGPPPSYRTMLAKFEGLSTALADKLAQLNQAQWEQTARLWMGGQVVSEKTVGEVLRLFHFDLIHHRGQLTTCLRSLGSNGPSIYGKSGDQAPAEPSHAKSEHVLRNIGARLWT
jgi:uncharacterized damage-inducible protein DinB